MSKSTSGKGDDRRPMFISELQFAQNWDAVFGNKQLKFGNNEKRERRKRKQPARTAPR